MGEGAVVRKEAGTVHISLPFLVRRRGGAKTIVIPDQVDSGKVWTPLCPAEETLVVAVIRAHRWQEMLDAGYFETASELARAVGMDISYVKRILALAGLSPSIVEDILNGNEPEGFSLDAMHVGLESDWPQS